MTPSSNNDELLLLAFRYVSGELSAPEQESFEAQLAEDVAAQQALADVVQLSEAVAIGAAERAVTRRQERVQRRTGRRQVVAAACAGAAIAASLFVLAGRINRQGDARDGRTTDVPPVSSQEAHSVVTIWSALGSTDVEPSIVDDSTVLSADGADAVSDEIPDWMLAAVAGVDSDELPDPESLPHPMTSPPDDDEETL